MESQRSEKKNVRKKPSRRQQLVAEASPSSDDLGLPSLSPPTRRKSSRQSMTSEVSSGLLDVPRSSARDFQRSVSDELSVLSESQNPIPPFRGNDRSGTSRRSRQSDSDRSGGESQQTQQRSSTGFRIHTAVPQDRASVSSQSTNPAEPSKDEGKKGDVKLPLPPWLFKIQADEENKRAQKLLDSKYNSMKTLTGTNFGTAEGEIPIEMELEAGGQKILTAETTLATPTSGGGKHQYRAGERRPGAYEVNRRAPGYLPAWFRRAPVEPTQEAPSDQGVSGTILEEDEYEEIKLPFRWGLCIGLAACVTVLIGIIVAVVVVMSGGGGGGDTHPEVPDDLPPPEASQPPELTCDFTSEEQPDPYRQCACTNSIQIVSEGARNRHKELRKRFMPSVLPGFEANIESCEPHNLGLVWLAMDTETRQTDWTVMRNRYILAVLYALWDGGNWKQSSLWLSSEPECHWYGVSCIRSVVTELILPANNIHGLVPTEIGMLTGLRVLDFSDNFLEGTLPEELFDAVDLEQIILWTNSLEGTLNHKIGALRNLRVFGIEENMFTGTLPATMASMDRIKWFLVQGNDFEGPLFNMVQNWPELEALEVRSNSFEGTIPSELGNLSKLRIMDISANDFQGTFPSELGNIKSMEYFVADGHQLTGSLPTELGKWDKLAHLAIMTGRLQGTIPTEIGQLALLEDLVLAANDLAGAIPSEFGRCAALRSIDVGRNKLTGTVPSELGMLSHLRTLKVDGTRIWGTVPEDICDLRDTSLSTFWIPCRSKLQCYPEGCCTPQCS